MTTPEGGPPARAWALAANNRRLLCGLKAAGIYARRFHLIVSVRAVPWFFDRLFLICHETVAVLHQLLGFVEQRFAAHLHIREPRTDAVLDTPRYPSK